MAMRRECYLQVQYASGFKSQSTFPTLLVIQVAREDLRESDGASEAQTMPGGWAEMIDHTDEVGGALAHRHVKPLVPIKVNSTGADGRLRHFHSVQLKDAVKLAQRQAGRLEAVATVDRKSTL